MIRDQRKREVPQLLLFKGPGKYDAYGRGDHEAQESIRRDERDAAISGFRGYFVVHLVFVERKALGCRTRGDLAL